MTATEVSKAQDESAAQHVLTQAALLKQIRALGISPGDHLALGASVKALGPLEGGAEGLIDTLLAAVGPQGTLMANAFTEQFSLARVNAGATDYVFDHGVTPCNTGLLPELMRRRDGALRSSHPVTSVVAIGREAAFLTSDHNRAYSPYSRLAELDGKYLALGIGKRLVGFRHEAQDLAGLLDVVPKRQGVSVRDDSGEIKLFINRQPPGCVTNLGLLVDHLDHAGLVHSGAVGQTSAYLMPARESLVSMSALLGAQPELNLCGNVSCYWCRELERRMQLFDRIEKPRYFQRYRPVISLLALVNRLRRGDSRGMSYAWRVRKIFP
ncbi:MAG: AAC(3) family N-acetyltransferase [Pseudomonadota bacterium]